jgi:hypothetical protein
MWVNVSVMRSPVQPRIVAASSASKRQTLGEPGTTATIAKKS